MTIAVPSGPLEPSASLKKVSYSDFVLGIGDRGGDPFSLQGEILEMGVANTVQVRVSRENISFKLQIKLKKK